MGDSQDPNKPELDAFIQFDSDGTPDTATFSWPSKGNPAIETSARIALVQERYPKLKSLISRRGAIPDEDTRTLVGFTDLVTLYVAEIKLTQSGLQQLQSLNQLTTHIGIATEAQEATIAKELPNVEFHNRL